MLGPVHGEVGAREQLGRVVGRAVEREGDADAGADADAHVADVDRLARRLDESRADRRRLRAVVDALGDDDELVAAEPREEIPAPGGVVHAMGDLLEDRVADRVPVRVVGPLEVIEVDEQDGDRLAAAARPRERLIEELDRRGAVVQAGERVVRRLVNEALLEGVALDDRPGEHGD